MRLFVAVDIDDGTREQLGLVRQAMEAVLAEARRPPRVTWVSTSAAHVTVRFIGDASEDTVPALRNALSAVRIDPFDVIWGAMAVFGGARNPRVIAIAPTSGAAELAAVATRVASVLDPLIGEGETRRFKPHVTVARIRDAGRGADWPRALGAVAIGPTVTRVDHVTLYQSRLSPKGPTYTALSGHG